MADDVGDHHSEEDRFDFSVGDFATGSITLGAYCILIEIEYYGEAGE